MFFGQLAHEDGPDHPRPQSPFESLANELIIIILEHLDVPTLLRCKQVSHFLSSLIDGSISLEYNTELYAANLIDGPPSTSSRPARLRLLKEHQYAWNNVSWLDMQENSLKIQVDARAFFEAWELRSGLVACTADRTIRFTQLPSRLRGIHQTEWTFKDIGFKILDFAFDKSQDLLAVIELPRTTCVSEKDSLPGVPDATYSIGLFRPGAPDDVRVHLRTLSTGKPHPLAMNAIISILAMESLEHSDDYEPVVEIYMGHVAVMVTARKFGSTSKFTRMLWFWDWKSGIFKSMAHGPINTFSFLTETQVLLGVCRPSPYNSIESLKSDIPSLDVIDIGLHAEIDVFPWQPTIAPDHNPPIQRSFQFPLLSNGSGTSKTILRPSISIQTDYSTSSNPIPAGVPFALSPSDRLLVLVISFGPNTTKRVTLFVRLSSMLLILSNTHPGHVVPWSDWGPFHTRMLYMNLSINWFRHVHGLKVVVPPNRKRPTAEIWDFNRAAVRRVKFLSSDGSSIAGLEYTQHRYLVDSVEVHSTGVKNPSVRSRVFEKDVFTSLPCRITAFSTPDTRRRYEFMITDDSLVLIVDRDSQCIVLSF